MDSKNAYEEVLDLLPEKCIENLRDDLSNGRYSDHDFRKLHHFLERTKEASFYFDIPKVQKACDSLRVSADELYRFLVDHYFISSSGHSYVLYPERRETEYALKTEEGEMFTWNQLRESGLMKARYLHDVFIDFTKAYRFRNEVEMQELVWEEMEYDSERVTVYYRGEDFSFESDSNSRFILDHVFADRNRVKIDINDIFQDMKGIDYDEGDTVSNRNTFKQAYFAINEKVKRSFNTDVQFLSLDGIYIKRNI